LRLTPGSDAVAAAANNDKAAQLRNIKETLDTLTVDLRARRPERGPAQDQRQAIDLVLQHLEDHGESLWGHVIVLADRHDNETRVVDRTNNILEGFWHRIKHAERRRSGRKVLTYDFEGLPAAAALTCNLAHSDYVQLLCGSLENLPQAFAELDATTPDRKTLPSHSGAHANATATAEATDLVSASLPRIDRPVVRTASFQRRIDAAASSRAPRYCPATRCATEF